MGIKTIIAIIIAAFGAGIYIGDRHKQAYSEAKLESYKQDIVTRYFNTLKPMSDGELCDFEYIYYGTRENCQ